MPEESNSLKKSKKIQKFGWLEALVGLLGGSVLMSALINLNHTSQTNDNSSVLHSSLKDFMQNSNSRQHENQHLMDEQFALPGGDSELGGLSCADHGGPMDQESAEEMVYWRDIPSDVNYVGPFYHTNDDQPRYLTFEPDGGGWNNIRMAMETVIGLGIATGRTIVLPPDQRMYLLSKNRGREKTDFSFADFFPLHEAAEEHPALKFISTEEFLKKEAMSGNMRNTESGQVTFPPNNRTDWNGQDVKPLKAWLQNSTLAPHWSPGSCLAAFPASGKHEDVVKLHQIMDDIHAHGVLKNNTLEQPTPVDASAHDRLYENLSRRQQLCIYNETMQAARVVHFMCNHKMHVRMLVHFYAFLFFEDWRDDLWMKRFMRDHMRYIDEIQCAAARIVKEVRELARKSDASNTAGEFDTLHVRRGDFQFKKTRLNATDIFDNVKDELRPGGVVFIATDERNKSFFDIFKKHYVVKFLDDYQTELEGVNSNYFGMIDQLIASKGKVFFGCWHSTFTGFIHRIRGYYAEKHKLPGYKTGVLPTSYYYATIGNKFAMHSYAPLHGAFFNREVSSKFLHDQASIEYSTVLPSFPPAGEILTRV